MPDAFGQALATTGLVWLIVAIGAAGLVRGFAGFGNAMVFVPVANIFLDPKQVITVIALTGVASTAALVPRAWREGNRPEVGLLVVAAIATVPLGFLLLEVLDRTAVRWVVSAITATTLTAMIVGWRFSGIVSWPVLIGIGTLSGVIGGLTGLAGPVVILFYLAGQSMAQSVRANTILFLTALEAVLVINLLVKGVVNWELLMLALVLAVPYFTTTMIGQALFDPRRDRLYRWAAYGVIGVAVLSGLPIWQQGG